MDEPNVAVAAYRKLQSYVELDDLQLMVDERTACAKVVAADLLIRTFKATLGQQPRAAVGKGVDHGSRASRRIVVELCSRSVNVPGMK
jgi:hypothetical protein